MSFSFLSFVPALAEGHNRLVMQFPDRVSKFTRTLSSDDLLEHVDKVVWIGTAIWFRFIYQYTRKRKQQQEQTRGLALTKTDDESPPWWKGPALFWTSLVFWHPRVQILLWRTLESASSSSMSRVPFDIPGGDIIASLDAIYFTVSAFWFRFLANRRPSRATDSNKPDGRRNNSSNTSPLNAKEADLYQRKREMNFKDPILHDFIQTCQEHKQQLRSVPDPQVAREEKLRRIRLESSSSLSSQPQGSLRLSAKKLQFERERLNKTENSAILLQ